jgi:hypothetical protein
LKNIIKLEELAQFLFSIFLFSQLEFSWWMYPALILLPDLGMVGYLINNQTGAYLYNLFHHKAIALIVYVAGVLLLNELLMLAGIVLFGHASMDRMFGYGLKYEKGFKFTHLGDI